MNHLRKKGTLYLIPTPLADIPPELVMSSEAIQILKKLKFLIVEQLRTARRLLKKIDQSIDIDSLVFNELNKFTDPAHIKSYLDPIFLGEDIGLISEAGSPCVADPGALVVRAAHELGIKVKPLSGPSSINQALMASGFNGQSFCFHGYLPIHAEERVRFLKMIEKESIVKNQTQIFIETPFRNDQVMEAVIKACNPSTLLCVASNISLVDEMIATKNLEAWENKRPDIHKKPTVFLIWNPGKD